MAAIVRRAAVDLVLYKDHDTLKLRKLGEDAHDWIFENDPPDESEHCSFLAVCSALNVDPATLRERILLVTEEDARRLRGLDFQEDE